MDTLTIDELRSSLLVHEQRINGHQEEEQVLKVTREDNTSKVRGRGMFRGRGRGCGRQPFNKATIECFKCHKLGYFQYECPNWENGANYAELDEEVLLISTMVRGKRFGFSILDALIMCGNKEWFSDLDDQFKQTVCSGNNLRMEVMGKGNVRTQVNGIPQGLIIQSKMSANRMFVVLVTMVPKAATTGFQVVTENETHLWHCRFGHLSFNELRTLQEKKMRTRAGIGVGARKMAQDVLEWGASEDGGNEAVNEGDLGNNEEASSNETNGVNPCGTDSPSIAESKKCRYAMNIEIEAIIRNKTWELINPPKGVKTIGVKWVFKTKLNKNGEIDKCKARLVAKGIVWLKQAAQAWNNKIEAYFTKEGFESRRKEIWHGQKQPSAKSIVPSCKLSKDEKGAKSDASVFKQVVGSLMYLIATILDLMYGVSLYVWCESYIATLVDSSFGDSLQEMRFKKLIAYSDCDFAGDIDDRKNTSGYVFLFSSGAVSWASIKQPMEKCTTVLRDNSSTIKLSKNRVLHGRSQHIDIRFHFLSDLVRDGVIDLKHCNTEDQVADIMTKPLKLEVLGTI
ncbi:hypothetical protein CR513_26546, partial [Mucuna pruriens]